MMFGDEPLALRQPVGMRADSDAVGIDAEAAGERVERDVDRDAHESDGVPRIDEQIEVRDHIPFDVVLPGDHTPGLAAFHGGHDRGHVGHRDQLRSASGAKGAAGQHLRRARRGLMGE